MGVPVYQVLLMVVVSGVGAEGLKSGLALKVPDPGSCGYDVIEECVKVNVVQVVVGVEEVSGFVAEFSQ